MLLTTSEKISLGKPLRTCFAIAVHTSDRFKAGTDANVFVQLIGEWGVSRDFALKQSLENLNKFERNDTDTFLFAEEPAVGPLTAVRLWHDNSGPGAGWHVACVDVTDTATKAVYHFECDKWFAKDEDDKKIERILPLTKASKKQLAPTKQPCSYKAKIKK